MAGVGKGAGTGGESQGTSVENQLFPRHFSFSSVLLGDGVPGWPPCSKPFIPFPITHPSSLLPASSDAAINILPAFTGPEKCTLQIKGIWGDSMKELLDQLLWSDWLLGPLLYSEVWDCWVPCFKFLEEWNILLVYHDHLWIRIYGSVSKEIISSNR